MFDSRRDRIKSSKNFKGNIVNLLECQRKIELIEILSSKSHFQDVETIRLYFDDGESKLSYTHAFDDMPSMSARSQIQRCAGAERWEDIVQSEVRVHAFQHERGYFEPFAIGHNSAPIRFEQSDRKRVALTKILEGLANEEFRI